MRAPRSRRRAQDQSLVHPRVHAPRGGPYFPDEGIRRDRSRFGECSVEQVVVLVVVAAEKCKRVGEALARL